MITASSQYVKVTANEADDSRPKSCKRDLVTATKIIRNISTSAGSLQIGLISLNSAALIV